jgi:DNA-binding LytR/AlgR family response regulator
MNPSDAAGSPATETREPSPYASGSRNSTPLERISIKSVNRIVIVPVADISRLEAEDNYVRIWADRPHSTRTR